ncbi:hypothetical protein J6590_033848 [Homalodisca vitripennis]|nr:hypothetical protein J6590_033848 [Homalodisca vitripennis]
MDGQSPCREYGAAGAMRRCNQRMEENLILNNYRSVQTITLLPGRPAVLRRALILFMWQQPVEWRTRLLSLSLSPALTTCSFPRHLPRRRSIPDCLPRVCPAMTNVPESIAVNFHPLVTTWSDLHGPPTPTPTIHGRSGGF